MGYSHRTWRCPYYRRDYQDEMRCEGGRVKLPTVRMTQEYMKAYCASCDWHKCSLAAAMQEKYDGGYRNGKGQD